MFQIGLVQPPTSEGLTTVPIHQIVRLGYARLSLEEVPYVDWLWLWNLAAYPISYRGFIHPR